MLKKLLLLTILQPFLLCSQNMTKAPIPKENPIEVKIHDEVLIDEFSWLRNVESPEVIKHLESENAYTDAMMFGTLELQEKIYQEVISRTNENDATPAYEENGYIYYREKQKGENYYAVYRQIKDKSQPAALLIDVNSLAKSYTYFNLFNFKVSPDNQWVAYLADTTGTNNSTLFFRNIRSKEILALPNSKVGDMEWLSNSKDFVYTSKNEANRSNQVFRQSTLTLNLPAQKLLQEDDVLFNLNIVKSLSGKYIFINSSSFTTSESLFLDASKPNEKPILFLKRQIGHQYKVYHFESGFLFLSNKENIDYQIFTHPIGAYKQENLQLIYSAPKNFSIKRIQSFKNFIALYEKGMARTLVRLIDYSGQLLSELNPANLKGNVNFYYNQVYDTNQFSYSISSYKTPETYFDYNLSKKENALIKETKVPVGFNPDDYLEKVIFAKAKDGAEIPITLFYSKNIKPNSENPLYLYGYGAYGIGSYASFNPGLLSLTDRGFIVAIAHVRGGDEMGQKWYETGKMKNKLNSFHDFIAVAEHLIQQKFTTPNQLIVKGGSAGGLLMGAVSNMRPDLFRAIVLNVPFVDVINTMLDETLPLTTEEFEQWGNPKILEDYQYIRKYSPYENVSKQKYPLMLFTAGIKDQQVGYWEPAKMVARIRKLNPDGLPVLFKCQLGSGHGGSPAFYNRIRERAFELAFMLSAVGINQ